MSPKLNQPTAGLVKQWEVHRPGTFQTKHGEIRQNGSTILHTTKKTGFFSPPEITIQLNDKSIIAAVRLKKMSSDKLLLLGNPDCTDKSQWITLEREGFTASKYGFNFNGRRLVWTRTHNKDFGASTFGSRDFKLVDESSGQVLMVYRYNSSMFKRGVVAHADFYAQLEQPMELLGLAGIMGIEEGIARSQRSNAAAASGGGGGGA